MPDSDKIQRDKGTILAIIKYLLVAALTVAAVYLGSKLIVMLLPFLAGLVLARTSIAIANRIHHPQPDRPRKQSKSDKPGKPGQLIRLGRPDKRAAAVPEQATSQAADSDSIPVDDFEEAPAALQNIGLSVAIYVILMVALFALSAGIIFASIAQLRDLVSYLPEFFSQTDLVSLVMSPLRNLEGSFGILLDDKTLMMIQQALLDWQNSLVAAIPDTMSKVLNGIGAFVGSLPAIFLTVIVILLSGYYFITDSGNIYRFLRRSINNKSFLDKSVELFNILSKTLLRVIGGYMLLMIITFILVVIGLLIIQMPYAVIFALVAAVVDLLPVLGLSATIIPISIYMFVNGQVWGGVGAIILYAVVNVIRRFIEPPILGTALRLHPMATLFSMIVGVAVYGLGGVLIGPVILVIAKEILSQFGFDLKLRKIIGDILTRILD